MKIKQCLVAMGFLTVMLSACGGSSSSPTPVASPSVETLPPGPVENPAAVNGVNPDGSCTKKLVDESNRLQTALATLDDQEKVAQDPNAGRYTDFGMFESSIQTAQKVCAEFSAKYTAPNCFYANPRGQVTQVFFDKDILDCARAVKFTTDCDAGYLAAYHDAQNTSKALRGYLNDDGSAGPRATSDRGNYEAALTASLNKCESFENQYSKKSCNFGYNEGFKVNSEDMNGDCEKFKKLSDNLNRPVRR